MILIKDHFNRIIEIIDLDVLKFKKFPKLDF